MASNAGHPSAAAPDSLITIKVAFGGSNRRFKLPLQELNATLFPAKLRTILQVPEGQQLVLERFSDSSSGYIPLDPAVPSTYKQLYRAAKAKLKLRIKATAPAAQISTQGQAIVDAPFGTQGSAETAAQPNSNPRQPLVTPNETVATSTKPVHPVSQQPVAPICTKGTNPTRDAAELNRRPGELPSLPSFGFQVSCDICHKPISDTHFHCSICSNGDYDLCESCVDGGKVCPGERHWMIKRHIKNGQIVCNNTDRLVHKVPSSMTAIKYPVVPDMPGAFHIEYADHDSQPQSVDTQAVRTCNGCVRVLPEKVMVSCSDCDDFDLCAPCHLGGKTGHHPGHTFSPLADIETVVPEVKELCSPGRNVRHDAICDGCDANITGVRHKCLDCPDWDYCNDCLPRSKTEHKDHRFVPIYEPLGLSQKISEQAHNFHFGVYCDGPICKEQSNQYYIRGIRYKCAICNDTDFCAVCEAHPSNKHNSTHPLIKFKSRVKNVSVSTVGEDAQGTTLPVMGDKVMVDNKATRSASVEASPSHSPRISPNVAPEPKASVNPLDIKTTQMTSSSQLDAHFIKDLVKDGTSYSPDVQFRQVWTLGNPGPYAWPIGCSVQRVGGDNMLDIRRSHAASSSELAAANETNATTSTIEPGERFSFNVTLRTPTREGKHISYWRLKAPDGTAFGHKLWCDVEVKHGLPVPEPMYLHTPSCRGPSGIRYPGVGDGFMATPPSTSSYSFRPKGGESSMKLDCDARRRSVQHLQQLKREQAEERAKFLRSRRSVPQFSHHFSSKPSDDDTEGKFTAIKNQINAMEQANAREIALMRAERQQHMIQRFRQSHLPLSREVDAATRHWTPPQPYTLPERPNVPYSMAPGDRKSALAAAAASTTAAAAALDKAQNSMSAAAWVPVKKNGESAYAAPSTQAATPPTTKLEPAAKEVEADLLGSAMVYPKLEKESPASSTHLEQPESTAPMSMGGQTDAVSAAETKTEKSVGKPASDDQTLFEKVSADEVDLFEVHEAETVDGEESDDAPFEYLTDEEYDILDASDEEFANYHGAGL